MITKIRFALMWIYFKIFPKQWELFAVNFKDESLSFILQFRKKVDGIEEKQALYTIYRQIRQAHPVEDHGQIRELTSAALDFFHDRTCPDCKEETHVPSHS